MSQLTAMFCDIDDFCKRFEPRFEEYLLTNGHRKRRHRTQLALSEIMTILVFFHRSRFRDFKSYYTTYILGHLHGCFPKAVSYNRFVELMPRALVPLCAYLNQRKGRVTGIAFIDSFSLAVCHNRRIHAHKVFKGLAQRGKTSVGWFYGFKLHLIINDRGELLALRLTPGNTDDRTPVPALTEALWGMLYGDKGYISKALHDDLFERGVELLTKLKKNMKPRLIRLWDKLMLRKRALIESVIDQLKNISQVEHSRHRSVVGFMVNLVAGLVAYSHQEKKPSLGLIRQEGSTLPVVIV